MPCFGGGSACAPSLWGGGLQQTGAGYSQKGQHCFQLPQLSWEQPPMSRVPHSTRAGLFQAMAVTCRAHNTPCGTSVPGFMCCVTEVSMCGCDHALG